MNQLYVLFTDLTIGKIENICTCNKCLERNQLEVICTVLENQSERYLKLKDFQKINEILLVSDEPYKLSEIKDSIGKSNSFIIDLLVDEIINGDIKEAENDS